MCVCVHAPVCVCVSARAGVFVHFRVFGYVHTWMGVCMFGSLLLVCVCVCVCVCAWLPKFQRLISLSTSGLGDCKLGRVGRHVTDYKLVVRPWESGIRPCISCHFPTV